MTVRLLHGDALDVLATLPDCSVDAVVTDPPYGLGFMGREWDNAAALHLPPSAAAQDSPLARFRTGKGPGAVKFEGQAFQHWCELWARECLRVLKPGGHLAAFGGTRTYHRLVAGIEDAGFEIRDSIGYASQVLAWCYGSGFPKSLNVSRDSRFCRCVPGVHEPATGDARESASEVLLGEVRRNGEATATDHADLPGVRAGVHPDEPLPGGPEQDLLEGVRQRRSVEGGDGAQVSERRGTGGAVRGVRDGIPAPTEPRGEGKGEPLLADLRGKVAGRGAGRQPVRPDREAWQAEVRRGQPSLEGRDNTQAAEGELRRPGVRPVPSGVRVNGEVGRVRDATPSGHGAVDRAPASPVGSGEPQGPQPTEQRPRESGAVPVERGPQAGRGRPVCGRCGKPSVPAGLGTALKPSWEPIVLARKPLAGTAAGNVQAWGTGALNIDATRVGTGGQLKWAKPRDMGYHGGSDAGSVEGLANSQGRWPANVVLSHVPLLDESGVPVGDACADGCVPGCQVAALDTQSGTSKSRKGGTRTSSNAMWGRAAHVNDGTSEYNDEGGGSRFFPTFRYQAKAPARERPNVDGVRHPTVKPLALMAWLVRLVTPPGGTVLDPFAGSGTTAEACMAEGFACVAIEREADYLPLIRERIRRQQAKPAPVEDPQLMIEVAG